MTMPSDRTSSTKGHDLSTWFWPRGLLLLSLVILAAPIALWAALWLRTPWNIAIVGAIGAALWALARGANDVPLDASTRRDLRVTALWAFVPLALMCWGSGIGGWGAQTQDWRKHNAVLADLVRLDWPVRYTEASETVHLTYYTAFYLPAAFVGKMFGWTAMQATHQLGALIVMGLLAAWLAWIVGPRAKWVGVLFAGFGGMDYLAAKIMSASQGRPFQLGPLSLEWWEKPIPWWSYYSHATELSWVPHAALAGWLGTAILLRNTSPLNVSRNEMKTLASPHNWRDLSFDLVVCALLPLWNPWAWLGCLPFLVIRVIQQLRSGRGLEKWPWIFTLVMCAMQFGYLMSRVALPPGVAGGMGYTFTFTAPEYIREFGMVYFRSWLTFSVVEFGFYALLCVVLWRRARIASPLLPFLGASVVMLTLLPLFHYGLYNDLLRSAVVPLVVVCIACASTLKVPVVKQGKALKTVLVLALCIGGLHSVQYAINFGHAKKEDGLVHLPDLQKSESVYEIYAHERRPQLRTQYFGRDDSLWARWFLKP